MFTIVRPFRSLDDLVSMSISKNYILPQQMNARDSLSFRFNVTSGFRTPQSRAEFMAGSQYMVGRWRMGDNLDGYSHPGLNHHLIAVCMAQRGPRFELEAEKRHIGQLGFGDMTVVTAGVATRNRWKGNTDTLSLHLPVPLWEEVADAHRLAVSQIHTGLSDADPVISRIAMLVGDELERPARNGMLCESLTLGIFARLAQVLGGQVIEHCDALRDWRLRRVIDYIEANLDKTLSVAELAVVAGLSRSHFMQSFRDAFGQPPHQYILVRRIDDAKRRLALGRESVTEVGLSLGFSSHSHFSTVFRRHVGLSPREFIVMVRR